MTQALPEDRVLEAALLELKSSNFSLALDDLEKKCIVLDFGTEIELLKFKENIEVFFLFSHCVVCLL